MSEEARLAVCYYSWCPLAAIGWFSRRFENIHFISIGMRECAHFIQMGLSRRGEHGLCFSLALLEEEEIATGEIYEPLLEIAKEAVGGGAEIIVLMGSCALEIMKLDLKSLVKRLGEELGAKVVAAQSSGFFKGEGEGEDIIISALLELISPSSDVQGSRGVVLLGSASKETAAVLRAEMEALGISFGGFFPGNSPSDMARISKSSLVAPLYPYLSKSLRTVKNIFGATILSSLFPLGADGSEDFYGAILRKLSLDPAPLAEMAKEAREEAGERAAHLMEKTIMIIGSGLIELPLARLFADLGLGVFEVSTPSLNGSLAAELNRLKELGVEVIEGADLYDQVKRAKEAGVDLVFAHLSLANFLKESGFLTVPSAAYLRLEMLGLANSKNIVEPDLYGKLTGLAPFYPKELEKDQVITIKGLGR
ncbi:MAG: nitrogenase component 1 [Actinomycetota bacterium]|nr:nitrogenase component 1 [Actinomycetota bacterium]